MVGKTVASYEILSKAGEGGMGVVYRGRDVRLGREVALKFLFPDRLRSTEARQRFEREARMVSSVSHPNIATLFGCEETDDGTVLVFEYLPGGSLDERLREAHRGRPIPLTLALEWAIQIADGLAHAHRRGIVHRDIKPANILFDGEDRVKISDFGLAKAPNAGEAVTRTGVAVGTVAYMSPEQALGADVGTASDVYSFGVLLYEMFTGRRPFSTEDSRGALYHVLHTDPVPPAEQRPGLPPDLAQLILRTLRKKPPERPASMEEVAGELRSIRAAVESSGGVVTETVMVAAAPTPAEISQTAVADTPVARHSVTRRWLLAAIAILVVSSLLAIAPLRNWLLGSIPSATLPEDRKVAVLMVEDLNRNPQQEVFCLGLTDSLTAAVTQLSRNDPSLWVAPASEVRAEKVGSVRDARRLFGVNLAITASFQRLEDSARVMLNLVDAEQSRQIESRTVEVASAELSTLEQKAGLAIASMLRAAAGSAESPISRVAASAYEHYLQGRGYLQRFDLPENVSRAISSFENALKEEPDYALALAALGEAYLAQHSLTQDAQWLAKAQSITERAAQLDPRLAAAHVNLCSLYTRTARHDQAIAEGQLARELDPLSADAYRALASAYSAAGRSRDAEQTYLQAIDLRPGFWVPYKDLGVHYMNAGKFDDAERMFRLVIEKTPDNEWGYRNLASVYHFTGQFAEAESQLREAVARKPTGEAWSNLGTIFYVQGRYADAVNAYREATLLSPNDSIVWGNLADAYRASPSTRAEAAVIYQKAVDLGERQLSINAKDAQLLLGLALYSAKLGDHVRARQFLGRAESLIPGRATLYYQSSIVQELAGDRDGSLRSLESAIAGGYPIDEVAREPELAALRADARYRRILKP